ncbi:E3 ubiquitin-protein ligase MBR2-like [Prosopis cineraria]|uniref:E3 ubiquitin-protein ligase MBR2-like n=1 Tax=Prosopis cineraria TaxID=364024 RepID=UPI00240FA43E|nr:E3 ubiquitin-protein ligase MBR2-like [Prosopis cineraria]XP_054787118.1 E3 ubiquitin-protein ligase MBR2-like [Prosopis cineraria]XP_054787119.1 E3 ubiquitin-protein ligase MBR2-like [Prosopis cineraria]XP_054787120.1 E3 ubiquitin-protein ligase MBR2-like [Prosopis cineraria]
MQGNRRTLGSFPAIVSMLQEPSSSGSDMDPQTSLNHMQNPVDARLSDFLGSSGENACLCTSDPDVQNFGGWNAGEPSSSVNLHSQVNNDGLKAEHGWSSSCGVSTEDVLRTEERQFDPNNVTFPGSSNTDLRGNQSRVQPFFLQGSSSNHRTQNAALNMGSIASPANHGKGTEPCSSDSIHNTYGFTSKHTSFGSASCDHVGTSSGSSGYIVGGDNDNSSSSLVNWGSSCKRKALESTSGQLCTGGSSSSFLEAESSCWPTGTFNSNNASSSLNVSRPSENVLVTNPPVEQDPRNEMRQLASDAFPLIGVMGNVNRPLRNFDRRMNYPQRQESRHSNHSSSRQRPTSHPFNDSLELRLTAGVTAASSGAPQCQSHFTHIPGLPGNTHPFPWSGASSSRGAGSSTSYNSAEREVREELNFRIFPRDNTEHPILAPSSSGLDPTSWHVSSGNVNNSGSVPPASWIGPSSSVNSLTNPSWIVPHEVPTQSQQRLSEFSPWSFFPSMNSVSGVHNVHSASSSTSSGPPSFIPDMGNHQSYPRLASLMERRGDEVLNAPHSLRALAVDIEGRRRLISEIRQVLSAMRRGENLRAEDYMLFDPFIYHGMAELHDRHRDMRLDVDNMSYEELLALEERIGDVSTGLSEDTIMKLMKHRIYVSVMAEPSTDLEPCCICQEEYTDGEDVASLDCEHEFHTNCIKKWLKQKNLCPICKTTALAT